MLRFVTYTPREEKGKEKKEQRTRQEKERMDELMIDRHDPRILDLR